MEVRYIEIKTSPAGQIIRAYTPEQYRKEMTRRKNAAARARKLTRLQERVGAALAMLGFLMLLGAWVRKAYEEAQTGTTVVLLIPARTDTAYFHDYIYGKAEIRFLRGRLHFEDEDGNRFPPAPFPSMVVIYNGDHQCLN